MNSEILYSLLVSLTIGMTQAVKKAGLNDKYAPIVAVLIATALSAILVDSWRDKILLGLVIGLGSVGLYSGTKNLKEQFSLYKNTSL